MKKNIKSNSTPRKMKSIREDGDMDFRVRRQVRSFLRSTIEAADSDVFYFSMNGMVMPLSFRA